MDIPSNIEVLSYVEKNKNNGYVDLNYYACTVTKVKSSFMLTDWFSTTTNRIMGVDQSRAVGAFSFGINASSSGRHIYGYLFSGSVNTGIVPKLNTKYDVELSMGNIILNSTVHSISDVDPDKPRAIESFYLFKSNYPGDSNSAKKELCGRIYRTKIWEGNQIVRDLIPAKNKTTGYYGFYDAYNKLFYPASNKTAFTGSI